MARVFSAVDIEDDRVLDRLEKIRDTLDLGFSPVNREKMHITLEFFEDISEEEISMVQKALDNIGQESFNMEIEGLGAFPSEDYIRVIWAGINSGKIFDLQKQAGVHSVSSDNRHEFKPHITLMRVEDISRKKKSRLKTAIDQHRDEEIGEVTVDQIKLFESQMTHSGSKYQEISTHKL